jgi:hypothetical protein
MLWYSSNAIFHNEYAEKYYAFTVIFHNEYLETHYVTENLHWNISQRICTNTVSYSIFLLGPMPANAELL